jgi:4-hydroxymandelate oxidase
MAASALARVGTSKPHEGLPFRRRLHIEGHRDHRRTGRLRSPDQTFGDLPALCGVELSVSSTVATNLNWDLIKRLRDTVKAKLVLKGILAFEDAKLAADSGIDAIVVSNHGGRMEDGVSATIDGLPEIVEAVGGRMPILVDSGFRRGSDIVKALAIGAQAVCIGRPYLWGLGAFGQPGVERVLGILRAETRNAMQQLGAPTLKDLTPAMVRRV